MLNKTLFSLCAGALLLCPLAATASDLLLLPSTTIMAQVQNDDVRNAIIQGGKRHQWTVVKEAPGVVYLQHKKGSKVAVTVAVHYDTKAFSIQYHDSYGLGYEKTDKGETIHHAYNRWLRNLEKSIRVTLQKAN